MRLLLPHSLVWSFISLAARNIADKGLGIPCFPLETDKYTFIKSQFKFHLLSKSWPWPSPYKWNYFLLTWISTVFSTAPSCLVPGYLRLLPIHAAPLDLRFCPYLKYDFESGYCPSCLHVTHTQWLLWQYTLVCLLCLSWWLNFGFWIPYLYLIPQGLLVTNGNLEIK